jgi:hypothetical protein
VILRNGKCYVQSKSYFTTDRQSVSFGIEPLWDSRPDFGCSQDSGGFVCRGTFSLMKGWVCLVTGRSPCLWWQYIHVYFFSLLYFLLYFYTGKGKGKSCPCALTKHHAMKAYWGSGGIDPRILDLSTRWR